MLALQNNVQRPPAGVINFIKSQKNKTHQYAEIFVCVLTVDDGLFRNGTKSKYRKPSEAFRTQVGAIKEGSDVKGYYFFWMSDKIDKKTYEWTLRFTDVTLKTLKEIKLQESGETEILESSFNGTDLLILFYDGKENTMDYQVYGADGKKKFSYNRVLSKKEERYLSMTYRQMGDDDATL